LDSDVEGRVRSFWDEAFNGRAVVWVGTMSGTHAATLLGVPGTGRRADWRQCHLFRFNESGMAVEHDAIRDDLGLMRQVGVAPATG
jgi:predicted ester cyclase